MRLPVTERAIADVDAISACREIAMHDVSHDLPERTRTRDGDVPPDSRCTEPWIIA